MIIIKNPVQEPANTRKMAKEDTIPDVEKSIPKETIPSFWNKVDNEGDNNEKSHGSDNSPS